LRWKTKALIQNFLAMLPGNMSNSAYYWIQRKYGALRCPDPRSRIRAGLEMCKRIAACGKRANDKSFLEIGTGRRLNVPLALWLSGAREIVTVDRNPYLRTELVLDDVRYIRQHRREIEDLFKEMPFDRDRLDMLCNLADKSGNINAVQTLCRIKYLPSADATNLPLPQDSIDFCVSFTVFEHISPPVLEKILVEGNRVVKDDGLFVHCIDYSDHFAHNDPRISSINFLRFSDAAWERIAGNQFMYMNRLRIDDYETLFHKCNQIVVSLDSEVDPSLVDVLRNDSFIIDEIFKNKSERVLCTLASWFVTAKSRQPLDAGPICCP
jgi:SAM-dependent methyltransferase